MRNRNAKSKQKGHLIDRAEVARRLGVSPGYVDMLFRGERKNVKRLKEIEDMVLDELAAADQLWRSVKSSHGRDGHYVSKRDANKQRSAKRTGNDKSLN